MLCKLYIIYYFFIHSFIHSGLVKKEKFIYLHRMLNTIIFLSNECFIDNGAEIYNSYGLTYKSSLKDFLFDLFIRQYKLILIVFALKIPAF